MTQFKEEKLNLDDKTCPKREERLGTIKTYIGTVSGLVEDYKAGNGLEWRNRSFEQTGGCLLTQTVGRLVTIRDSVLIVHGPVGCAQATNGYREMFQNVPLELGKPREFELAVLSSNLTESDIVFGGEKKLRQAIHEAIERYNPQSIIIATSCASGVMGDDIEGIVDSIQPEIEASLVPVHCEGFRSKINQTAFDASAHAIIKYLVKPPRKKQEDLVNIIAPFSVTWADRVEINRLFAKIGLRARYVPDFATSEELETMSEAAVTAPTCPSYGDYLQKALYEKYGVPYFREPAPLGLKNTAVWFREIAKYTDKEKEVEALIAEETTIVAPQLEELKKSIKGSLNGRDASIFVAAGQARIAFIPRLAAELGVRVAAVSSREFDPYIIEELEHVYNEVGDFEVHAADEQPFEHSHMLNRLKPDLYTGCPFMGLYKREGSQLRNHSFRSDFSVPANQFVFRGILNYGYILQRALRNQQLCKTLKIKTPSPYRSWWYEQPDVLAYTKAKPEVSNLG
jgi:nitrogenase molybdenum-iron protein alpha chain